VFVPPVVRFLVFTVFCVVLFVICFCIVSFMYIYSCVFFMSC